MTDNLSRPPNGKAYYHIIAPLMRVRTRRLCVNFGPTLDARDYKRGLDGERGGRMDQQDFSSSVM